MEKVIDIIAAFAFLFSIALLGLALMIYLDKK
jgi:hypothetical protein